ncbi:MULTISPECIES: hypothetical protein [unclassified Fibrobacter]|uniref:hypothetical protein n=1 Tax=unclassified Fibrobacter TaxID=2634177 RepID=UPI000D6ABC8F|nr:MULTISPECIES: hypothetical protein [unclassified Fibrobacter]PWJ68999.1 hypothetical protein BGX12_10654 [Fibrobacter sp. UWR4]PZW70845.1 hypothetical protein C8E88_101037 [Fibrobacter sp. UWR1]
MKNIKKTSIILTTALMSAAAAFAAEDGAIVEKQSSLLQKLDSLNQSILGLRLSGTAKAGGSTSMATSDQFAENSATQENQAYTDVNLKFLAQPSSETRINVQLRLHKDWQSGYEENNNPAVGHWFSYDGNILNKHVDFNLGYMRVGYTPLTINTPQTEILQEPEIFAQNRVNALADRNLDTTSRRLMQGLNVAYNSGSVGAVDNIYAQATGSRMRNTAKKNDQVFFDFDWSDRYAYGLRAGAEMMGASAGVNFVNIFDRRLSTRSRDITTDDTLMYDDNSVLSAQLSFDSKKLMPSLPVNFGLNGEFAMSWWDVDREYYVTTYSNEHAIKELPYPVDGSTMIYVSSYAKPNNSLETVDYLEEDGVAFNIQPYVEGSFSGLNFKLNAMYLQNDEKFWSDLASSPTYTNNTVVLNSNALYSNVDDALVSSFASGNLENLYFAVYNTNILNATNLMTSGEATVLTEKYSESVNMYNRLFNNFKLSHFYRNGYDANAMKGLEAAEAMYLMDPSVNLALPFGIATPDRKGFAVSLDADWNEAISLNVRFSQYEQSVMDNKYTTIGAGVGIDLGLLVPSLGRDIKIQGSFEMASESDYLKRSTQRIVAGFNADIWGPIALQAGFQMLNKKFEGDLFGIGIGGLLVGSSLVQNVDEMLILAGPRIRIAPESYLTVRYGMLNNSVDYFNTATGVASNLSIDKSLVTAEVTVNF